MEPRINIQKWGKFYVLHAPHPNGGVIEFLHRLDGPAVEYENGAKEWWINGQRIKCNSQQEFERMLRIKAFW